MLKSTKLIAFIGLLLAANAGLADNYWYGYVSTDAHDPNNWSGRTYDTSGGDYIRSSDAADIGGNFLTLDFGTSMLTCGWATVSCDYAFSYDPIVFTGSSGGLYSKENFYVGAGGQGLLDIQGGNHHVVNETFVGQTASDGYGQLRVGRGATLTTDSNFYVAVDTSNEGTVTNYGDIVVGGQLFLTRGNNSKGEFVQNAGSLTVKSYLCIGTTWGNNVADALFELNGGVVTNTGYCVTIGSSGVEGTKDVLRVNGGELYATGPIWVHEGWDGGVADCYLIVNGGRVATAGAIFQEYTTAEGSSTIVVNGGELSSGNDFLLAYKGDSTFILSNGVATCMYWFTANRGAASAADIQIHGGHLEAAYGNGNERGIYGNGSMDLASYAGSSATYVQTGGSALFYGSANADTSGYAGLFASGEGAKVTLDISGGTLTMTGGVSLARGKSSYTELTVRDQGCFEASEYIHVGQAAGATGRLIVKDRREGFKVGKTFNVGCVNSSGYVYMENSNVSVGDGNLVTSAWGADGSGVADVNLNNSRMILDGDLILCGWNNTSGTTTTTLENGSYLQVGSDTVTRWFKIENGKNTINVNSGSTFALYYLYGTGGTLTVNLNGGTVKSLADQPLNARTGYAMVVGAEGGTIDVGGNDVSLGIAVSGEGVLSFAGSGSIKLPTMPDCDIGLAGIAANKVAIPSATTNLFITAGEYAEEDLLESVLTADGKITLAGGTLVINATGAKHPIVYKSGRIKVDASGVTAKSGDVLTVPGSYTLADGVSADEFAENVSVINCTSYTGAWVAQLDVDSGTLQIIACKPLGLHFLTR